MRLAHGLLGLGDARNFGARAHHKCLAFSMLCASGWSVFATLRRWPGSRSQPFPISFAFKRTGSIDDHHLAALFREAEYHADRVRYNRPDHPYARR